MTDARRIQQSVGHSIRHAHCARAAAGSHADEFTHAPALSGRFDTASGMRTVHKRLPNGTHRGGRLERAYRGREKRPAPSADRRADAEAGLSRRWGW